MASNPPFHAMEDQTDEDFFDKLVDDDFGPTSNSDSVAPKLGEGSDSDEAKAFANLSLEDTGCSGGDAFEGVGEKDSVSVGPEESVAPNVEENNHVLNDSTSLGFDAVIDSKNDGVGSEGASDSLTSGASSKAGIKVVGWNSFYADSEPNGNHEIGSYSDFFNDLGGSTEDFLGKVNDSVNVDNRAGVVVDNAVGHDQYQDGYGGSMIESTNEQDLNSSQYWESMYPGWKYDPNTGQWYQVEGFEATSTAQGNFDANAVNEWVASYDGKTEINHLLQTSQSVVGTVAETGTTGSVSSWNQVSQGNDNGYPEHMVFDPQYPGWYYDTVAQEWRTLESYTSSIQSAMVQTNDQQIQNGFDLSSSFSQNSTSMYGGYGQTDHTSQGLNIQGHGDSWPSYDSHNQQASKTWQHEEVAKTGGATNFQGTQQWPNFSNVSMSNHVDQQKPANSLGALTHDGASLSNVETNGFVETQNFNGNFSQQFKQGSFKQNEPMNFANNYFVGQKAVSAAQQTFQNNQQFSHPSSGARSPDGRPAHALVTFGFGGKLIMMKESRSLVNSSFGNQEPVGGTISVLNLMEVISGGTNNATSTGGGISDYFRALCQQSFPGPLVGGNVGTKELNKWIDERIANFESLDMDYRKSELLKLLLSLLKIACQHYGKLRSPFGSDTSLRESDAPESAVAKLFASVKRNDTQFSNYDALSQCLQSLPSEGQIRATASEVQNLLVAGRKREALQCAQEGQLWGPALVLASQLGDQFYVDTIKQMAIHQLVAGSPLRTLCLLIAGQPAEVFATDATGHGGLPGAAAMSQRPAQFGANGMLDDWEENLAVITANRTKDDELVIIHLGDCLWKDRSEIIAAHICYLVAEANFESYSDSARLCLIGADHWNHPRTYASPQAIQRTELYEYSKVLGNSQFILLPFQPYKLIYAYMLAEVGKVSDSLKYCQALLKSLKMGRAPEVETWKQLASDLDDRIKTHQQSGYAMNINAGKVFDKLKTFLEGTASRVVGPIGPPVPSTSHGNSTQGYEHLHQSVAPRVYNSQSTMAMSTLVPSASMEPISEWAADASRMTVHNRSVSEPDFGRTPRQVDSKEETSSSAQGKTSGSETASRFGRFGFGSQLLQKTVGLVLRPRSGRQAKLGEENKFYYDEKLKRWVEEGAEPPAEEAALPPPPTTASFQNGLSDYNLKSALKKDGSPTNRSPTHRNSSLEHASGIPPIPASANHFSARARTGVRARYVDTFNPGSGNAAKLFQSPSVPSVKPAGAANPKFFVPTPVLSGENSTETAAENTQEVGATAENQFMSTMNETLASSSPNVQMLQSSSPMAMQRFPSMDNITRSEVKTNGGAPVSSHSRRTASWSGSFSDSFNSPAKMTQPIPREALGLPPSSFMPSGPTMMHVPTNGSNFGDDLQEVEL